MSLSPTISCGNNAFIQFNGDPAPANSCYPEEQAFCLPCASLNDIMFELQAAGITTPPLSTEYQIKVHTDATSGSAISGNIANMNWYVGNDNAHCVGLFSWSQTNLATIGLKAGQCFRLGLWQNTGTRQYWYTIPPSVLALAPDFVSIIVDGHTYTVGVIVSSTAVIASTLISGGVTGITDAGDGTHLLITSGHTSSQLILQVTGEGGAVTTYTYNPTYTIPTPNWQFYGATNCLVYNPNTCNTRRIKYLDNKNVFGFDYYSPDGSGGNLLANFANVVRLPIQVRYPEFPAKKKVYRKSDGTEVPLMAVLQKQYDCETDYMTEAQHTAFKIALEHFQFNVWNDDTQTYQQMVNPESDNYKPDWDTTPAVNYPLAKVKFKLLVTPFYNTNSNING